MTNESDNIDHQNTYECNEDNWGFAWRSTIPIASHMFSVTKYSCATGYYAFGHEIGHNFNMQHDRGTVGTCSEANTYNYGYRDPKAEYMTILSYSCKVGQCDNMPKNGCTRIQRFSNSNPSYTYNGKPIGDAKSDNAKQFNNQRSLVASFYPAMDCICNSECNDGDSTTVDTCNIAKSVCVLKQTVDWSDRIPVKTPERIGNAETIGYIVVKAGHNVRRVQLNWKLHLVRMLLPFMSTLRLH